MWIHSIITIAYCVLFICARGFFSKSGSYLAGKIPPYYHITKGQVRFFLLLVFCGNLLGFSITLFYGRMQFVTCMPRAEESYTQELYVTDGELSEKMTVEIGTEPYSEDEKITLLEDAVRVLPEKILGENESFNKIEYPLQLISEIPENGILIQWDTNQPLILDWEGAIGEQVPEEGTAVQLKAELLLDGCMRVYEKEVMVYPQKKTKQEIFREDIEKQLSVSNEQMGKYLQLPEESSGKTLKWSNGNQKQGILITGFTVLVGILLLLNETSRKRKEKELCQMQMLEDYPGILNKLILLMRAGMSSRRAIEKIALDYRESKKKKKRYAYEEIVRMYREMEQGISEEEVYRSLANRCELICYRSLSTLLIQNLKKGSSSFLDTLKKECTQAFEERKNRALVKGEQAGTKLLIPMVCMLLIVLVIILVPSMMSLG